MTKISFDEYQKAARVFALYPNHGTGELVYPVLGLSGEAGECGDKVKKMIRDHGLYELDDCKKLPEHLKASLLAELGDVLWYAAAICNELGVNMSDVANSNLHKLQSRMLNKTLQGSGDNR